MLQVPLAVPLRMFEVFTSTNSSEDVINCDEALIVGNTFLYLVKRGMYKNYPSYIVTHYFDHVQINHP